MRLPKVLILGNSGAVFLPLSLLKDIFVTEYILWLMDAKYRQVNIICDR